MTLTLNAVIPFFHRTFRFMMMYYQTKFGCKQTSSLEDTRKIIIFWSYKSSLWPWHWKQWTNFYAWHSGFWCCISIPGLATKCSVVWKITSGRTFTNINPIFPQLTMLYYQTKFGCKWTSSLEDIVNIVMFWLYKPSLWPWHWRYWTNFSEWHVALR